ncbi:ClpP/crotonase-like domain-containing protein [Pisolithus croceorrhizus]|nr:ClpP/crotonase-like domain-containing protein [Pisolithus croceorrhizus]
MYHRKGLTIHVGCSRVKWMNRHPSISLASSTKALSRKPSAVGHKLLSLAVQDWGGIPMGVIAVETRTIERIVPADSCQSRILRTARDGGRTSLVPPIQPTRRRRPYSTSIGRASADHLCQLAWFFSGGQQDMYDEVLKQGSKIVDGLSSYKQPVFVYIVPNGELRGGAWVVLDPSINSQKMEMYADVEARAGVLEPEGIVEIKMRRDKILSLMERLDSTYASLKADSKDSSRTAEERAKASQALAERESLLQPIYKQIALLYADLHDRTGRMEAKGCARPAVWKQARRYFYWRLRARLARSAAMDTLAEANPEARPELLAKVLDSVVSISPVDDRALATAFEELDLTPQDRKASIDGIVRLVDSFSDEERQLLQSALQNARSSGPPSYTFAN